MNVTEQIALLTSRIQQLEDTSFDEAHANTWWLLSNGILCAGRLSARL